MQCFCDVFNFVFIELELGFIVLYDRGEIGQVDFGLGRLDSAEEIVSWLLSGYV